MTQSTIRRRRPERTARTREAIIAAAARRLAEHGYEATSLEAVAIEAGIARATVYYHFTSKESLYEAVLLAASANGVTRVEEAVAAGGSNREVLLRFLRGNIEETLDTASRYIHQNERVRTDPETRKRIRASQRAYVEAVAQIIDTGQRAGEFLPGQPMALALIVIGAAGSLTRWYRRDGDMNTAQVEEVLARIVLPSGS